jgi:hypothetical protein
MNRKVSLQQSRQEIKQITQLLQKTLQPLCIRRTMLTEWWGRPIVELPPTTHGEIRKRDQQRWRDVRNADGTFKNKRGIQQLVVFVVRSGSSSNREKFEATAVADYGTTRRGVSCDRQRKMLLSSKQEPFTGRATADDILWYKSIVGSLIWLVVGTRVEIAYAVSLLSRSMANTGPAHKTAAQRVLRWVAGTVNLSVHYSKDGGGLVGFTDAD